MMLTDSSAADESRATMLRRWWAICGLVLFAATWRLWVPQAVFPQVPLFRWASALPSSIDWFCFGSMIVVLIAAAVRPHRVLCPQVAWPVFAVACAGSILIDQHRLQPWVWLLLLMSLLFDGKDERDSPSIETLLRWLTMSVYCWSAVSKFDRSFFATHGPTLVEALFRSIGGEGLPGVVNWWLAVALPVGELLVAVGLNWPRSRQLALWGAISLHVALILALGPLGLGHRPGVLLWNVAFIGHDWLLFRRRVSTNPKRERGRALQDAPNPTSGEALALAHASGYFFKTQSARTAIILFVVLWPITESFGLCDHWLAWSVYSTRTERVSVVLTAEGIRQLPEPTQRLVVAGELPLDRWSIDSLQVPIYPQLRFQLGVVDWLRRRCGDENVLEVIVVLPGSRLKGDVATEFLPGDQVSRRLQGFWVNAFPTTD